jgi:SnoaL-like domain
MNEYQDDKTLITEAVESIHRYRDHAMWDKITDYFVEKPYINDTELTKEAPGIRNIKVLIGNWRNELRSYFYATRHRIQSMTIRQKNSKEAEVISPIMGQYFVNDRGQRYVLNVEGTYTYEMVKKSGKWKVGSFKFMLKNQELKAIGL